MPNVLKSIIMSLKVAIVGEFVIGELRDKMAAVTISWNGVYFKLDCLSV